MTERFVETTGTISIGTDESTVVGTGTLFAGRDRAGASVIAVPEGSAPIFVGIVAEVDPRGIYDPLQLPLVAPYHGPPLEDVAFMLVDGAAIANGATQAAIFARFAAHLESRFGLAGVTADGVTDDDLARTPKNTLFWDPVVKAFFLWRNGVLEELPLSRLGDPAGDWDTDTTYAKLAMVQHEGHVFISNADDNTSNEPDAATPASTEYWTWLPLPSGAGDLFDFALFVPGRPIAGRVAGRHDFRGTVTFPAGLTASRSTARVAAAAEAVFALKRNGTTFGTATFAAAGNVATLAAAEETVFTAGDILEVVAPDPRDATLADISITLAGNR